MNIQNLPDDLQKIYGDWVVDVLDDYSPDYDYLKNNWKTVCDRAKVKMQKIILVKDLDFKSQSFKMKTKLQIAEDLTKAGYIVRRAEEFMACYTCRKALPCYEVWLHLKKCNLPVPEEWKGNCKDCKPISYSEII